MKLLTAFTSINHFVFALTLKNELFRQCASECLVELLQMTFHLDTETRTCYLGNNSSDVTKLPLRHGFMSSVSKYWPENTVTPLSDVCSSDFICHFAISNHADCLRDTVAIIPCKSNSPRCMKDNKDLCSSQGHFDNMIQFCDQIRFEGTKFYHLRMPMPRGSGDYIAIKIKGTIKRKGLLTTIVVPMPRGSGDYLAIKIKGTIKRKGGYVSIRKSYQNQFHMNFQKDDPHTPGQIRLQKRLTCSHNLTVGEHILMEAEFTPEKIKVAVDGKHQCDFKEDLTGMDVDNMVINGLGSLSYVSLSFKPTR